MKVIKQHDEKDCGAACLTMILEYYGRKIPLAVIRQDIKVDKDGANILGIIAGAEKYYLDADAYGGEPEDAWSEMARGEYLFPIMIRILNEGKYEHFVIATGMDKEKLKIIDPALGKKNLYKFRVKKPPFTEF